MARTGARISDLAGFFGPAVFGLTRLEQATLEANMPRLKARRRLDEIEMDPEKMRAVHPDELFELVYLATGNEPLANSYRVARLRADWKPR